MAAAGYPFPGQQNPTAHDVFKNKFFVSDVKWEEIKQGRHVYDLVIIGSGFCGLTAASRALEKNANVRILMIERGDYFLPGHFKSLGTAYVHTRRGLSETFPWSLSHRTFTGELGTVTRLNGMVPFFGGRSIMWNAWCPRPSREEMADWPQETIDSVNKYLVDAETLLNVQPVSGSDYVKIPKTKRDVSSDSSHHPLYDRLQSIVDERVSSAEKFVQPIDRVERARIAKASLNDDFHIKFSTPPALLDLVLHQKRKCAEGRGEEFDIVCNCVVERIIHQDGRATGLQTSRGDIMVDDAMIVLAAGTLPATTLVRNSFPEIVEKWPPGRFAAHFVSVVTARVPIYDEVKESPLELSANYISGWTKSNMQFHIQINGIVNQKREECKGATACYLPVVLASANESDSVTEHVLFKCTAVGQLNHKNEKSWFRENGADSNLTTNSILQIHSNSATDLETWDAMDQAMFDIIDLLKNENNEKVEYCWTKTTPDGGSSKWAEEKPDEHERRKNVALNESSTMYIGKEDIAPVDLNYKLRGTTNVYVTGGALWPTGGSWNPCLTMVALTMDLIERLLPIMEHDIRPAKRSKLQPNGQL